MQCFQENISIGLTPQLNGWVEFNDSGKYITKCHQGHTNTTLLQQQKFEILFDIGAHAIIDGYYREAVSSFTSSLERFYEFFIKVICLSNNISVENITSSWKDVSNQSERQLGAFIFLYLNNFGTKPKILNNDQVKFRNSVIHKGMIPSQSEAIQYGQNILDLIHPLLNRLKLQFPDALQQITLQHLNEIQKNNTTGIVSTACISTIISLTNDETIHDNRSLIEAIAQLKRW